MKNGHLDAIREILDCLVTSDGSVYRITDAQADQIETHAEGLAAQIERLQRYGELWEEDFRETMQRGADDPYVEATIRQMRSEVLQSGDLSDREPIGY